MRRLEVTDLEYEGGVRDQVGREVGRIMVGREGMEGDDEGGRVGKCYNLGIKV